MKIGQEIAQTPVNEANRVLQKNREAIFCSSYLSDYLGVRGQVSGVRRIVLKRNLS
jgi:hypothetical protein